MECRERLFLEQEHVAYFNGITSASLNNLVCNTENRPLNLEQTFSLESLI